MKKILTIISLVALFSCNNSKSESKNNQIPDAAKDKAAEMTNGASNKSTDAPTNAKKYDSKSGIITYETTLSMNAMKIKTKQILYFDDYGVKECQEEYNFDEASKSYVLDKTDFVKDGFRYIISLGNKSGIKSKASGTGVNAKFDLAEAATQKENQFKKLGDETICGKSCNGFSMVTPSGIIKMFGWNKIALKTTLDNSAMKMKSECVATKIEENVSIPADKFEVPKDVKLTDY